VDVVGFSPGIPPLRRQELDSANSSLASPSPKGQELDGEMVERKKKSMVFELSV
jgi:hypothetical protein